MFQYFFLSSLFESQDFKERKIYVSHNEIQIFGAKHKIPDNCRDSRYYTLEW